jgi:hypothetical protein
MDEKNRSGFPVARVPRYGDASAIPERSHG